MAYTQDDLVRAIVGKLFGLATGQPVNTEDAARVVELLPSILSELSGLNIIYIADGDSVPDAAFNAVSAYAAEAMAEDFMKEPDAAKKARAESRLRTLQRIGNGTGQNLKTDLMLRAGVRRLGYRTL